MLEASHALNSRFRLRSKVIYQNPKSGWLNLSGQKQKNSTSSPFARLRRTLHTLSHSRKGLPLPPVSDQRCIVLMMSPKLQGTPKAGHSSLPSPLNGLKCTYKYLGQPTVWSLKYWQLCTPDGEPVNLMTRHVNTSARTAYETLQTQFASSERRLHPEAVQVTLEVGRQAHSECLTDPHVQSLCIYTSSRSSACLSFEC